MATVPDPLRDSLVPLERLLARLRREARAWIWVESLALTALAAAALFWASLAFDWLVEPPAWVRAGMTAAAAAVVAWILLARLVARLATPLSDRSLALAVERRHPACGDTLSTAVDLAAAPREGLDGDLVTRTATAAAALARDVKPRAIFRRGTLLATAAAGLAAAGGIAALVSIEPAIAALWARRMVMLDDAPWPRRVRLEAEGFVAGVRTVARGSDVDVTVLVAAEGLLPDLVEIRSRGSQGGWRVDRMGTRGGRDGDAQVFGHVLAGVVEDLQLEVRGGDARLRGLRLLAVDPPSLASVEIRTRLPAYLGGGERRPPASRVVQVPRGSRVEITCTSSKPLAAATIADRSAGSEEERPLATASRGDAGQPGFASISGEIAELDADCTLTVALTDTDGLVNREPIMILLDAVPDEPPRVAARLEGISTAVTPAARLPVAGSLTDDHGLTGAAVSLVRGDDRRVVPIAGLQEGQPLFELTAERPAVVPLEPLGLAPGERIAVAVTARDGCGLAGGPNEGVGETWTLDVVTPDQLQAMLEAREVLLRRRFEAAIEDLAQARSRLDAAGESPGAAEIAAPPLDPAVTAARLGEAAARAAGEAAEIAAAFRGIRDESRNNGLLTPEVETRLVGQIADPLQAVAAGELARLGAACRAAAADGAAATPARAADAALRQAADAALARMREVLSRMLELESFNEVVERLKGVIRGQERIRADTLERQRQRAREALESP